MCEGLRFRVHSKLINFTLDPDSCNWVADVCEHMQVVWGLRERVMNTRRSCGVVHWRMEHAQRSNQRMLGQMIGKGNPMCGEAR